MSTTSYRRGLSRVEVLVVACIGVIAVGLFLPALARVQAAARGDQCRFNLSVIALAAHNYESVFTRFPPGMDRQYVGVLVYLLPFIEQDGLYRNFSFDPQYSLYWQNPYNRPPSTGTDKVPRPPDLYGCEGEVRFYLCPEASQPEHTVTALLTTRYGTPDVDYRANDGLSNGHIYTSSPGRLIMGRSHYLGIGGDYRTEEPYGGRYRGIFTYNSQLRLGQIEDGTSNTLFFAETWGGYVPWKGAGGIPSGWNIPSRSAGFNYSTFGTCPNPNNPACNYDEPYFGLSFATFGSWHGETEYRFNVAFADGSVRSLPGDIDYNMWLAMSGYRDGMLRPRKLAPEEAAVYSD